ncbi:hypothetical protein B0H14DRAFT_3506213 [Mycena olivaceomarginata]|nr:hypothetical protein B0H14DRAFT_3506213 [Mycena olivaceomarginata]
MSLPSRRLPACTRSTTLSASTDGVLCDPLDDARTAGGALGVAIPEFAAVCLRPLPCISMGGMWGLAASTALENLPVGLRGLASGVLQQGYAVGYLIAAVISLELVPTVNVGWRALSWTASGISIFGAALRALLPKSSMFMKLCSVFPHSSLYVPSPRSLLPTYVPTPPFLPPPLPAPSPTPHASVAPLPPSSLEEPTLT